MIAQLVNNLPAIRKWPLQNVHFLIPETYKMLPYIVKKKKDLEGTSLGGLVVKTLPFNVGSAGFDPWSGS